MKRRDLLRAGAAVAGAALLPAVPSAAEPSRAGLVEALRADYLRRVRDFAARVRPEVAHVESTDHPDDVGELAMELEERCQRALIPTEDEARLLWALSDNWQAVDGIEDFHDIRRGAAVAVAADVADALGFKNLIRYYRNEAES